jgi:hypothetical protein
MGGGGLRIAHNHLVQFFDILTGGDGHLASPVCALTDHKARRATCNNRAAATFDPRRFWLVIPASLTLSSGPDALNHEDANRPERWIRKENNGEDGAERA